MKPERLQEIKNESKRLHKLWVVAKEHNYMLAEDIHTVADFVDEVVTALEAAQAELAEAWDEIRVGNHRNGRLKNRGAELLIETAKKNVVIDDLRKQLAEEQSKNGMLETLMSADKTIIKDALLLAETELAETQVELAEVSRQRYVAGI